MHLLLIIQPEGQGLQKSKLLFFQLTDVFTKFENLISHLNDFQLMRADETGNAIYLMECQAGEQIIYKSTSS